MSDVTEVLDQVASGESGASDRLLALVYEELRRLARARIANEPSGQTLQPTALVHEAYLRLVDVDRPPIWSGRAHFFGAAAEAMRRILVERARQRRSLKRGGACERVGFDQALEQQAASTGEDWDLLALDEALRQLEREHPPLAELIRLRYFAGLGLEQTAELLGLSRATAQRRWVMARAWLFGRLRSD